MPSSRLVEAVDGLVPISYSGPAYRHQAAIRNPLSGAGARSLGGRWNPPESISTLYLAIERDTAVAEFLRMAARSGRTAEDFLPRRLYRYDVHLVSLVDLRTPETREALELSDSALISDDPAACQAVGEAAQYVGLEGIIAPSATGSGTVLAVFFDRLQPNSGVQPVGFETWQSPPG